MAILKYSCQRESIKQNLMSRRDHPTADMVYEAVRQEYPNISLGTVYRNLTLLVEQGEVLRLSFGDKDHFDGDTSGHYHFICQECGEISDLFIEPLNQMNEIAARAFDGEIDGHFAYFYGRCGQCKNKRH